MIKFKTSQGSEYFFDPIEQKSKRTKKSGGSEQGKEFSFLPVVFIKDKVRLYYPNVKVYVGIFSKTGSLNPVNEIPKSLSENDKLVVVEVERQNPTKVLHIQRAFLEPAFGFFPFETGYNESGEYIKHLGNDIVEIEDESNI
jgi:hypothetical protein